MQTTPLHKGHKQPSLYQSDLTIQRPSLYQSDLTSRAKAAQEQALAVAIEARRYGDKRSS